LRRRLFELEGERPETLEGWRSLTAHLDVEDVRAFDRSERSSAPAWCAVRDHRPAGVNDVP